MKQALKTKLVLKDAAVAFLENHKHFTKSCKVKQVRKPFYLQIGEWKTFSLGLSLYIRWRIRIISADLCNAIQLIYRAEICSKFYGLLRVFATALRSP